MQEYIPKKAAYLAAHPWCQISIAERCLDEDFCLKNGRKTPLGLRVTTSSGIYVIPPATDIHHRNKRHGKRLLDERWWMSASRTAHRFMEDHLAYARNLGYVLDISANPDGFTPAGVQALTTPDLLKLRADSFA